MIDIDCCDDESIDLKIESESFYDCKKHDKKSKIIWEWQIWLWLIMTVLMQTAAAVSYAQQAWRQTWKQIWKQVCKQTQQQTSEQMMWKLVENSDCVMSAELQQQFLLQELLVVLLAAWQLQFLHQDCLKDFYHSCCQWQKNWEKNLIEKNSCKQNKYKII